MNKSSIVILTYNGLGDSALCIDSIRQYTPKDKYEIIVVDNHSTDGTVGWLKNQKDIRLIENQENKGFAAGCNQGIGIAEKGNDILLLNNDTMVTPSWLENLQACLHSAENIGAVGPVSNYCSNGQQITANFNERGSIFAFANTYNRANPRYKQKIKLVGFCMLIKREVVDTVGLLDERFFPGNYEDDDYSFRIEQAGYCLMLSQNTFVYHSGSVSFQKDPIKFRQVLAENAHRFADKWGFQSVYSTFVRTDVLALMQEKPERELSVLEVGCACGATLLKIKDLYPHAKLYGLESNPNAAAVAASFADVKDWDVEQMPLPYGEQSFDYILFADVLEHLKNPGRVLQNMKRYLKQGGYILASIPNIMHYSVMNGLLCGRFTYEDAGILDRTHLRFFTLSEIRNLFIGCQYEVVTIQSKMLPQYENDKPIVDKLVSVSGEDMRAQYNTYQYLVKARYTADEVQLPQC
ncbi:MAG: glycosyltransferase [Ethanoligenens sp.]